MTIWKFPLQTVGMQSVQMPRNARILCVQVQRCEPCLWAMVDETKPLVERRIRIIGTEHPIDASAVLHYIGTYQLDGGGLVFHVFEDAT